MKVETADRVYVFGATIYVFRDILIDGRATVCQYATADAKGKIKWIECRQGSEFSDIQPFLAGKFVPDEFSAAVERMIAAETSEDAHAARAAMRAAAD